ncbi:uncharacterized protein LOC121854390 isoform X1 [Homarus americanus]|uniref:Sodium-dependent glucose transporter 1-like 2 n=1 Tax=Homarus americanus TaxID=6706 RepID=A0A8J5JGE1_HOMAM|nr:uncharacterized protein LOC121854390 isoform X1 [Homarus americanus]KAG7155936.1 Sodium-dependent glucose transporter 1-like 2 [Homarus americanus]
MADHTEDNDPFEEDIVFDETGLLGGKMPRSRQQSTVGFLPTFMLFIRTVFLCTAFVGLGLCMSVSGEPLIKMELVVGTSVDTAFHTFTARSFGMLLGGILGSLLFEVYNRQFLIFVSLIWVAVSVTVLPFTVPTALWWTFTTTASLGMGLGFLFTGGNVLCLDLWGRQGGASLQALHFSFAVGAFIVPLVIQPFFASLHTRLHSNLSDGQDLASTDKEVMRFIRELQDTDPPAGGLRNFSLDLPSISLEEIKHLTYPKEAPTHEIPSLFNNTVNLTLPVTTNYYDRETSISPVTTPVMPVTIIAPNISSTLKTPKMKPPFTDANRLKPDLVKEWKRPHSDSKSKSNTPKPGENKEQELNPSITNPSSSDIDTNPPTASQAEVVETTKAIEVTTHLITSSQQTVSTAPEHQTYNSSLSDAVEINSASKALEVNQTHSASVHTAEEASLATEKSELSPTSPTTTIKQTSTSTTSTTTSTTQSPTTTTSTTPVTRVAITPTPQRYPIVYSNGEDQDNVSDLEFPMQYTDYANNNNDDDNHIGTAKKRIEQDDTSPDVHEPKVLEYKESIKSTPAGMNTPSDEPGKSEMPSLSRPPGKPDTFSNGSDENTQFLDNVALRLKVYGVTKVHLAYICIGIFIILNALISLVILCHNPRETRSKQDDGNMNKMQKGRIVVFTIIFSVFMFMAEALQGAVHHLLASSTTGTGLAIIQETKMDGQVLFWGLVCLVRFLCILVSGCLRLKPGKLLVISILLSFIGSIFLAIGSFGKEDFLWGGVIFLAIGLAPVLPTSLLWMAQYMRVTHRMCALMIVLASFGNSLTHSLLTRVAGNSHSYAYILVTISFVCLFFLFLSMCNLYAAQRSKTLGVPVGYQLANQHEEEDSIELTPSGSAVFTPNDPRVRENGEAGQSLLID